MLSVESVPYTVGKLIAPAFQIGASRFLQTKSREARPGDLEAENSGIRQIAISVYRLRNSVEVQLYVHTVIPVYTFNCIIPYLILNRSGTTRELNISVYGEHCCALFVL